MIRDAAAAPVGRPVDLPGLLRYQQLACGTIGSEVYVRVIGRTLELVERGGPVRDLLLPHAQDPFGSALALRYLGAVHRLVLEGRAPDLAAQYPSVGGRPDEHLEDAFEAVVTSRAAEVAALIDRGVQTNEVGRSAALLGGFLRVAEAGLPLRLLELGASGGLNLLWDHYRYESSADGRGFGPTGSALRFVDPWVDRRPRLDLSVTVAERRGCDRSPVDATTDEGRLTLRSYVWPDLTERFARLDAAIAVARSVPVAVEAADAVDWATAQLAEPRPGLATVVAHSIVAQYLTAPRRAELVRIINAAGARASREAPLAWLRFEPGPHAAEVRLTAWPGGEERLLATSPYHGPPVTWLG